MARRRSRRGSGTGAPPLAAPLPAPPKRRWRVVLAVLAVGAVTAGALAWWRATRATGSGSARLDVLLITVDTLRADALGAYGRAGEPTPSIDRLSAAGVRFDDAHAHNVVTLPSHANILSGRYPLEHGVRDNAGFRFPPSMDTLATLLKADGYATGAFVSAFPLAARFGLARGFDVYDDQFVDARPRPAFLEQERKGTETVARARRWMEAQRGRPFFCWVHVYEPHAPYAPPEPFASRFRDAPYEGEVAAADAALGPVLDPLLAQGEAGHTLVVLTGDHGESLGEHGEATHGLFAYEATLRVPLIVFAPARLRPRVEGGPARHVDILPTVLDAVALPIPAGLPGRSLLRPPDGGATTYFEALAGQLNRGWAPLTGLIRDDTKYVDLPLAELYDLRHDRAEARNLLAEEPREAEARRAALAALRAADRGLHRTAETAETRERLAALGYVGGGTGGGARRYTSDDDPKRLVHLDAMLQDVVARYTAGDLQGALAGARELVRLRPAMAVAQLHLAALEREAGHMPEAIAALQAALAAAPGDPTTLAQLGTYLTEAGRPQEAVDALKSAAEVPEPDVDVLVARGLALARTGQSTEALATLERARQAEPANAMLLVDAGTVHVMAGDRAGAREAFEAALRLNPDVARAHSSLGFLLAEAGRRDDALAHWKQAIALDPAESGKLIALVTLLAQSKREAEARPYVELFVATAPPALFGSQLARARSWLAVQDARPR